MGFILVEQTQTSVEHTKFSLLYFVEHNQTMLVEHNHTMPVEHTNVTRRNSFLNHRTNARVFYLLKLSRNVSNSNAKKLFRRFS